MNYLIEKISKLCKSSKISVIKWLFGFCLECLIDKKGEISVV